MVNSIKCLLKIKINSYYNIVGFVAAAVSMPMGGCRAVIVDGGVSLLPTATVDVPVAVGPAVL